MPSNYPPGVTGGEDHLTGLVELPVKVKVTFEATVTIHGQGKADGEDVCNEAVRMVRAMVADKNPDVTEDSSIE